jgi:hypothetical protein
VVIKQTVLHRRAALELLGAGDVLAPPLTATPQTESRSLSRYLAYGPVSLAALETHFRLAARRWPEIADFLHDRLVSCAVSSWLKYGMLCHGTNWTSQAGIGVE